MSALMQIVALIAIGLVAMVIGLIIADGKLEIVNESIKCIMAIGYCGVGVLLCLVGVLDVVIRCCF